MKCKKGDAPKSSTQFVAIAISLLALYLILYFFLLPEEMKQELLDQEGVAEKEIEEKEIVKTLLMESPGMIYPYTKETTEKRIPSVSLFSTLKTDVKTLSNSLYVSKSIFGNNYQELNFNLDDLESVKKLDLFFDVRNHKGSLNVYLNDVMVFSGEIRGVYDLPIDLPVGYLQTSNVLRIEAAFPGWKFLTKNYYELRDIKLIKNYKVENKKEIRSFVLDDRDKVGDADINFYVNCLEIGRGQGILKVEVNRFNVYTSRVVCDAGLREIDIPLDYLVDGRNIVQFEIDKGDYIIEQIEVELRLESKEFPTYYFMLNKDDLYKQIKLKMEFEEDVTKRATIVVNGKKIYLDTKTSRYEREISDWLKEGENYIKLVPKIEFEVLHLEVGLVE